MVKPRINESAPMMRDDDDDKDIDGDDDGIDDDEKGRPESSYPDEK